MGRKIHLGLFRPKELQPPGQPNEQMERQTSRISRLLTEISYYIFHTFFVNKLYKKIFAVLFLLSKREKNVSSLVATTNFRYTVPSRYARAEKAEIGVPTRIFRG